jgi:hypothetical protein
VRDGARRCATVLEHAPRPPGAVVCGTERLRAAACRRGLRAGRGVRPAGHVVKPLIDNWSNVAPRVEWGPHRAA